MSFQEYVMQMEMKMQMERFRSVAAGQPPLSANEWMAKELGLGFIPRDHTFEPHLVYGVGPDIPDNDGAHMLAESFMASFKPDVKTFAREIVKGHATTMVYGCEATLAILKSKTKTKAMQAVDTFAEKYGLGKPEFMMAVKGDYHHETHKEVTPEPFVGKAEVAGTKKRGRNGNVKDD